MNKHTRLSYAELLSSPMIPDTIVEKKEFNTYYWNTMPYLSQAVYSHLPSQIHQQNHHHLEQIQQQQQEQQQQQQHLQQQQQPPTPQPMPRTRGRRVSNIPNHGIRMFGCKTEGCGKVFKRSEHLKRHIRSIHTMEKRKI
ncbi:hypothetical protein HPULCUR_010661 [Helicostylum pulchrum]|uniref:C2H2-type domain-containing protein n=1 Tax=Helicostylum pulchrum TaxID=562976 RepID=A0ABP9YEV3_9FUNG